MNINNVHSKPTDEKHKEIRSAVVDVWKFNHIEDIDLSHYVISGGKLNIPTSSKERLMIVTSGMGSITETKQVLREGSVVEVSPSQRLELHGQLKFYLIEV